VRGAVGTMVPQLDRMWRVRQELLDPLKSNARFEAASKMVHRIYRLLDAGKDFSEPLAELNKIAQKNFSTAEMEDAAELIDPRTWAYEVIADLLPVPTDLNYAEMLELVEQILVDEADSPQLGHWARCLEANTGDRRISTLLQSPELYFQDATPRRLTAKEVLDTALATGRKAWGS
jgi:hypothetical protein